MLKIDIVNFTQMKKKFEKHISTLNDMLYADSFDKDAFCWNLDIISELGRKEIVIYDFVLHNDVRRHEARRKKADALHRHDYKEAAHFRDIEKACEDYLVYSKDYPQEQSMFELIGSQASYLHFGTAPNDKKVMEVLMERK